VLERAKELDRFKGEEEEKEQITGQQAKEQEMEMEAMLRPTWVKIQPFGGAPGENLDSFLRRCDCAVRCALFPEYPDTDEARELKYSHPACITG
jgi:hypothetical protein